MVVALPACQSVYAKIPNHPPTMFGDPYFVIRRVKIFITMELITSTFNRPVSDTSEVNNHVFIRYVPTMKVFLIAECR